MTPNTPSRDDDTGQVAILILGFAVMLGLLVTVVVDASTLFLDRRALVAIADSAALAAAQQVDEAALYGGDTGLLPLDAERATAAAVDLVAGGADEGRFGGLRVTDVSVDGGTVRVEVAARVRLPFSNVLTRPDAPNGGVSLSAVAAARAPITP